MHLLSDPDGDGIMTEEDCLAECLSLATPDPACVSLEILETTFTVVDADGTVLDESQVVCLTCLDALGDAVYTDCGGALPAAAPSSQPATEVWCDAFPGADETTLCWDCFSPDGAPYASGCASTGEPIPEGSFCTPGTADGLVCVWCCDLEGAVLLESCGGDPEASATAPAAPAPW